jgi:hypothetical protein
MGGQSTQAKHGAAHYSRMGKIGGVHLHQRTDEASCAPEWRRKHLKSSPVVSGDRWAAASFIASSLRPCCGAVRRSGAALSFPFSYSEAI